MPIEQAVFTSARTDRFQGYQLVARSPGVTEEDARELALWGPSHGSLRTDRDEASSVNFHRLASGMFCVSKTVVAGEEYSGRGGGRIYTQILLVPPEVLARFANNPFAVLRAAWAKGVVATHERVPAVLESFSLAGRAAIVDEGLVAQLADQWGPRRVGRLAAAAIASHTTLLLGARQTETLIGGLINCFPVECRNELTFTTGLRFSPRRPFRLTTAEIEPAAQRRLARHEEITLVDLSTESETDAGRARGWAAYVAEAIASDQLTRLVSHLQRPRPGLSLDQLDALGQELLADLRQARKGARDAVRAVAPNPSPSGQQNVSQVQEPQSRPLATREPAISFSAGTSSGVQAVDDPASVELLENLDDAVYEAINGVDGAAEKLAVLWTRLAAQLDRDKLLSAREQYLRYTLTLWDACLDEGLREPDRAIRALDVLSLLFEAE